MENTHADHSSLLLELALAIEPRQDRRGLLAACLPLFVQRLECVAGAIFDIASPVPTTQFAVPRKLARDAALTTALEQCRHAKGMLSFQAVRDSMDYLWPLPGHKALLLRRSTRFSDALLHDLAPVIDNLGDALEQAASRAQLIAENRLREHINLVLASIRGVNRLIVREKTRDPLLAEICRLLVDTRGYFNAWIVLIDLGQPVTRFFKAGFGAGEPEQAFEIMTRGIASGNLPHCGNLVLAADGVHQIHDPRRECGDCPLASGYSGRSGLSIRLEYEDDLYGWLTVSIPVDYADDAEEIGLLREVAGDVSFALHALEVAEQQRNSARNAIAMGEMFTSLGSDSQANIDMIVRQACELTGGAASLYNRLDAREKSLVVWSGHNLPPDMPPMDAPQGHICYEATILGKNQTIAISNLEETGYRQSDPNVTRYGLKSYLGHPVHLRDKAIGSLAVVDGRIRQFGPGDIGAIQILARALSLEEERHAALERLEHVNRVLTAIRNVNHLIVQARDQEHLLSEACRLLVETHGFRNAWIVLVRDGEALAPVYHAGDNIALSAMADYLSTNGLPQCGRMSLAREGVHIYADPPSHCAGCPMQVGYDGHSGLAVRLAHEKATLGWLTVSVPVEYADDPEEHSLLLEVAGDIAYSLYSIELAARQQHQAGLLAKRQQAQALLTAISTDLLQCSAQWMDGAIELALGQLSQFAGADRGYVFLFPPDEDTMNNTHEWTADGIAAQRAELQDLPTTMFPWWMARLRQREFIYLHRLDELPAAAVAERAVLEPQGIQSLLVMPIADEHRLHGFVGFDWVRHATELDDELLPLMRLTANILHGALNRKQTEDVLRKREEEYRLMVENQSDLLVKVDRDGRFEFVSPSYCRLFGKSQDELLGRRFLPLVHEDDQARTLEAMQDLYRSPYACHVEQRAMTRDGWRWLDWVDTAVLDEAGQVSSIVAVGRDIGERKLAEAELRQTLEDVIDLLGRVVEHRDPYTSGHQKRVAQLAKAIAEKMELEAHLVEAVYMGGLIHDLGKIAVPAEILSKPGKLAVYEFTLIQQHPLTGFDIIRQLKFPWDIARMVLQHHEKLDGSGYPHGLVGDQIQLESRILSVADVVEAMSTHRPYRPALGTEQALAEISRNSGRLFDAEVVAACTELFEAGEFSFQP